MKIVKTTIIVVITGILTSMTQVDEIDHDYFPMELKGEVIYKYMDSDSFVKVFDLKEKVLISNNEYIARLMQYSWGKIDTTYFRTENLTVYYYDKKSNTESINLPNDIKVGSSWVSTDNAWKYEITSINAKLNTPEKKYKNLLEIKATQFQNRDKTKLTEYLNYYEKNVGKIASVTNGKIMTYKLEK